MGVVRRTGACLVVAACAAAAAPAEAGGFKVQQGGPSVGNAGAGTTASGEDPSTVFFNPAGLSFLTGDQVAVDATLIRLDLPFRNDGSTNALGGRLRGGDGLNAGGTNFIPSMFVAMRVNDNTSLGLGVSAPFGLATDYGTGWVGRYQATHSALETTNLNPSAAYRLTDAVTVGAGFDVQYAKADLENAIDFGLIGFKVLGPGPATALGLAPEKNDGSVRLAADDFGYGANAGATWQVDKADRVGFAWRSQVRHELKGDATFVVPTSAQPIRTASGQFRDTGAQATLTMPETLSFGSVHEVSPQWTLLTGADWTHWERFQELRVKFDNPKQADQVQPERWRDAWRLSLGATWRPDPRWTLRCGVAYDQTPVPDRYRTPRLPDANRRWIALGAGYRVSDSTTVELAYAHEFLDRAEIHQTSNPVAGNLNGHVNGAADILSLQLTIRF